MMRIRRPRQMEKQSIRPSNSLPHRSAKLPSTQNLKHALCVMRPTLLSLTFMGIDSVAHAQETMDFSGADTLMETFKTFAMYAGAIICLGGLIFAGIRMMTGRFQDAIPGLFGALFGAAVLGWGAGWIGSIGWHTFRHTYRSWLNETGAPMKVQQELMRHASIQTTMNVYGQAMSSSKREANGKVVEMVLKPRAYPHIACSEMIEYRKPVSSRLERSEVERPAFVSSSSKTADFSTSQDQKRPASVEMTPGGESYMWILPREASA